MPRHTVFSAHMVAPAIAVWRGTFSQRLAPRRFATLRDLTQSFSSQFPATHRNAALGGSPQRNAALRRATRLHATRFYSPHRIAPHVTATPHRATQRFSPRLDATPRHAPHPERAAARLRSTRLHAPLRLAPPLRLDATPRESPRLDAAPRHVSFRTATLLHSPPRDTSLRIASQPIGGQ